MRKNTYESDAFKYGVILFKNKYSRGVQEMDLAGSDLNKNLEREEIIDFSRIDGLTLEDLESYPDLFVRNKLFFVMYDNVDVMTDKIRCVVQIDVNNTNPEQEVASVVENWIRTNYQDLSPNIKNRANCFMQRHIYGSYADTQDCVEGLSSK